MFPKEEFEKPANFSIRVDCERGFYSSSRSNGDGSTTPTDSTATPEQNELEEFGL
jgi:hypothetical protein